MSLKIHAVRSQNSATVFYLFIQNNNFLTNNSVGCPAATNLQTICDSYFIDRLAFMTVIVIDSF